MLPKEESVNSRQRNLVFGIVNLSHLFSHMESGIVSVLYPVMMGEMGFGYFAIGVLQTIYQVTAMGFQVVYGFLARFFPRSILLGIGNILLGLFVMATGFSQNLMQVGLMRGLTGMGSSVQHPVGAAILVSYFEKARGRMLTLHYSVGNLGSFLASAVAGGLLLFTSWRTVFYAVGIPSILMGFLCFFLRDAMAVDSRSGRERMMASMHDYRTCIRNRNVMLVSMIQMVGAAGRGTGINVAFLTAFFMTVIGVNVTVAAGLLMLYQLSGLVGPLAIGWLSDRFNRKRVVQMTLFASTVTTLWFLVHRGLTPWLILNIVLYGSVIQARGSLTQSMVSEAVPLEQLDVAFSLYFFIGFISGPAWTFLMGWLIDAYGFAAAFKVISVSYLLGLLMVFFTMDPQQGEPQPRER
jgi:MFS family permease